MARRTLLLRCRNILNDSIRRLLMDGPHVGEHQSALRRYFFSDLSYCWLTSSYLTPDVRRTYCRLKEIRVWGGRQCIPDIVRSTLLSFGEIVPPFPLMRFSNISLNMDSLQNKSSCRNAVVGLHIEGAGSPPSLHCARWMPSGIHLACCMQTFSRGEMAVVKRFRFSRNTFLM